jgi:hypothetical protein
MIFFGKNLSKLMVYDIAKAFRPLPAPRPLKTIFFKGDHIMTVS